MADVTIMGCDKAIGKERATQAVNAALDFLHLLFGHYHSRKMVVGGPGLEADIRAAIEVREGMTLLSYSVGATSAVGFEEGWAKMLESMGSRQLTAAAGRAIEAIVDPAKDRPLALRFIDAASWHGQAIRSSSGSIGGQIGHGTGAPCYDGKRQGHDEDCVRAKRGDELRPGGRRVISSQR